MDDDRLRTRIGLQSNMGTSGKTLRGYFDWVTLSLKTCYSTA